MSRQDPKRNKPELRISVSQGVQNRATLEYTPFVITPETSGYLVGDQIIPRKEFEKRYPVPMSYVLNNSENSDKTLEYLKV